MKNSRIGKLLSAVLCVLMLIMMLVSCNKKQPEPVETDESETNIPPIDYVPEYNRFNDYGGYEFCFLTQVPKSGENEVDYLISNGEVSEVISNAVYRRNNVLKTHLNIEFKQKQVLDIVSTVRTQLMGGEIDFDVVVADAESLAVLARERVLLDLNSVDSFEQSKGWWDRSAAEQLTVGGKLYFTNCDLNVGEFGNVIYFNKEIIKCFDLTSPYEYIKYNEWTIDNWAKLVSEANGVCACGSVDKYGMLYEKKNDLMFLQGAGLNPISRSKYGGFMLNEEKVAEAKSVYEKLRGIFDSEYSWNMDDMDSADVHGYANKYDYARSLFCQDVILFAYGGTGIVNQFEDMESEYGIVPFPKIDEKQESYYSLYPSNANLIALPACLSEMAIDRAVDVLSGLNYYSSVVVKPAWYDKLLQRRYVRDDESEFCLDLLYYNRVYDVGLYYGLYDSVVPKEDRVFSEAQYKAIGDNLKKVLEGLNQKYYID